MKTIFDSVLISQEKLFYFFFIIVRFFLPPMPGTILLMGSLMVCSKRKIYTFSSDIGHGHWDATIYINSLRRNSNKVYQFFFPSS